MSEQPRGEWDNIKHHPSCSPHDRDLVWHCNQCGANESAEAWHNPALAAEREKVKMLVEALENLHDDIAEYARINNLGGFDNHAMKLARAALAKVKEAK